MGGCQPRHCLDKALLRLADGILLRLIALTTVGAVVAAAAAAAASAAGSLATMTASMPAINVEALFIGREERGVTTTAASRRKMTMMMPTPTQAGEYACNFSWSVMPLNMKMK
jgi:hypothetical protein